MPGCQHEDRNDDDYKINLYWQQQAAVHLAAWRRLSAADQTKYRPLLKYPLMSDYSERCEGAPWLTFAEKYRCWANDSMLSVAQVYHEMKIENQPVFTRALANLVHDFISPYTPANLVEEARRRDDDLALTAMNAQLAQQHYENARVNREVHREAQEQGVPCTHCQKIKSGVYVTLAQWKKQQKDEPHSDTD
jgi:hypothetical protein